MGKKELEKGALRDLFNKVDRIMNYVEANDNTYPKNSHLFSSSIPSELDRREEIVEFFHFGIGKLNSLSSKLERWFGVYERNYLKGQVDGLQVRPNNKNLTIHELYLIFKPINRKTQKPYSERRVSDHIKESSWMQPVVNIGGNRYSPDDFKKFLKEGNIPFDKEISEVLLEYFNKLSDDLPLYKMRARILELREDLENDRKKEKAKNENS